MMMMMIIIIIINIINIIIIVVEFFFYVSTFYIFKLMTFHHTNYKSIQVIRPNVTPIELILRCRPRTSTSSSTTPSLRQFSLETPRFPLGTCLLTSRNSIKPNLETPKQEWRWNSRWWQISQNVLKLMMMMMMTIMTMAMVMMMAMILMTTMMVGDSRWCLWNLSSSSLLLDLTSVYRSSPSVTFCPLKY